MKVYLGDYPEWFGPHKLAETLCFWVKDVEDELGLPKKPDWVDAFGDWIAKTWICDVLEWIESKKKRIKYIKVDSWDTWSADHTLALIILPVLKQLKESTHGYPSTHECHSFEDWFAILEKMIWSFEQVIDLDWEEQYTIIPGEIDFDAKPEPTENGTLPVVWKTHGKYDWDGMKLHREKIQEGLELFGKYYTHLWD